jgi:hypothetical protein
MLKEGVDTYHEDTLSVTNFPVVGMEMTVRRNVLQPLGERQRQLAGRIMLAKHNVGDSVTSSISQVPSMYESRNLVDPGKGDRGTLYIRW